MTQTNDWRQHFTASEQPFVERCTDWIEQAKRERVVVTPFLDPREQEILQSVLHREQKLAWASSGGYPEAERCRIVIYYAFLPPEPVPLACLRLHVGSRLPRHQDVLGALLGLGIKREMIGDIVMSEKHIDVVLTEEIASFVELSLQKVGRERVRVESISLSEMETAQPALEEKKIIVSSMRLDAVLAEAFHCSRKKVAQRIKSGECKVNWRVVTRPSQLIEGGDVLSMRREGRIEVGDRTGMTKKGRYILTVFFYN